MSVEEFKKGAVNKKIKLFHYHILNKGGKPKGPLISHNKHPKRGMGKIAFMQQIHNHIETPTPYIFNKEVIVENCLFTRFVGKSYDLDFAYQKMNVYAYEEGITMADESYSVFLKGDPNQDDSVTVDIFIPLK